MLLHCWLGIRKSIWPVKNDWWGVDVVICLERDANCLRVVQLMPQHPETLYSLASFKSGLVLLFWYRLTQVFLEKRPLNRCSSSSSSSSSEYGSMTPWSLWSNTPSVTSLMVDEERDKASHAVFWLRSVSSVLRHCWFGYKNGIWPIKHPVSFQHKWRKNTEGNELTQFFLENEGGRGYTIIHSCLTVLMNEEVATNGPLQRSVGSHRCSQMAPPEYLHWLF